MEVSLPNKPMLALNFLVSNKEYNSLSGPKKNQFTMIPLFKGKVGPQFHLW